MPVPYYAYRVVWENQHGERFFAEDDSDGGSALRVAREAVRQGRLNVRVEVVATADIAVGLERPPMSREELDAMHKRAVADLP